MRVLYIDIDGVLYLPAEGKPREDAAAFLKWCLKHFTCVFLTGWSERNTIRDELLAPLGMRDKVGSFIYTKWDLHKTEAIDFNEPFYWIDDELLEEESEALKDHNVSGRFIQVNPHGEHELKNLAKILAIRESVEHGNEIGDLGGKVPKTDIPPAVPIAEET